MTPRLIIAIILLVGTTTPLAFTSAAAATAPTALSDSAPVYLALGDSLAFGYGASDPERTGYVPLVHASLRQRIPCQPAGDHACAELQLVNLAESGATTTSLLESQLPTALDLIETRNTDGDLGNDVIAITIDIGGNDAVGGVFEACAAAVSATCPEAVRETLATIDQNLTVTLMQLRAAAGPDTRIAVMTYFNSLIGCDYSDSAENAALVLDGVPGITPGLNGVIELAAGRADALVADTFGLLEVSDLVGGEDCLHANDAGYVKIADVFIAVLTSDAMRSDS